MGAQWQTRVWKVTSDGGNRSGLCMGGIRRIVDFIYLFEYTIKKVQVAQMAAQ